MVGVTLLSLFPSALCQFCLERGSPRIPHVEPLQSWTGMEGQPHHPSNQTDAGLGYLELTLKALGEDVLLNNLSSGMFL